jgi:hypothetical protein
MTFKQTLLWKESFDERTGDETSEARIKLRSALLSMRESVAKLVSYIPVDCRDLTVHDITHLDALWESAEQICGPKWEMNPAEAFVFGAAVLIHDAGLTTIAYPEGREGLKKTTLWCDLAATNKKVADAGEIPEDIEASILFSVLRELHATQASKLCTQSWPLDENNQIRLLEDSELREAFGESIGRIASSHHWSIDRVATELSEHLGGSPTLPSNWTVNEQKLACLLRCADAAQVDRTRSPLLLYAALKPKGYSSFHWKAQSKLNRPVCKGDAVYFSSSSKFGVSDSDSWWLAYDLARVLDSELKDSNALLTEIDAQTFAAQRVAGADVPRAFSKFVKTDHWRPIDASIRVSDPLKLAKILGGKHLYGHDPLVPFRELVQNASDAIRARRALEGRGQEFGKISITVEKHPTRESDCLIQISDNGIGMSERILCSSLVDFGRSIWTSDVLREEFPGLPSKGVQHIGKFGIGFFSIFDLASDVRVTSRRYDAGQSDIRSLDFRGIMSRPLLLESSQDELPLDASTQITMSVKKDAISRIAIPSSTRVFFRSGYRKPTNISAKLADAIRQLVSFLDIEVSFEDLRNGDSFTHSANIYGKDGTDFLKEVWSNYEGFVEVNLESYDALRTIVNQNGDGFGRAALDVDQILELRRESLGLVAVGGIIGGAAFGQLTAKKGVAIPFLGVVEGRTEKAARDVSECSVPEEAVESWLEEQLMLIDQSKLKTSENMKIGEFAYSALGPEVELPFAFHKNEIITAKVFESYVKNMDRIIIPASWQFDSFFEISGYEDLNPDYFDAKLSDEVLVFGAGSSRIIDDDDEAREIKRNDGGQISLKQLYDSWPVGQMVCAVLTHLWGVTPEARAMREKIFYTNIKSLSGERWCVCLEKPSKGAH